MHELLKLPARFSDECSIFIPGMMRLFTCVSNTRRGDVRLEIETYVIS